MSAAMDETGSTDVAATLAGAYPFVEAAVIRKIVADCEPPTAGDETGDRAWETLTGQVLADPVTARAMSAATSIAGVADLSRAVARRHLFADGVTFVLRDGDQCFYAAEDSIAPLWPGQRFPIGECISGWAMLNNQPAVIDDINLDERIPQAAYRATYVRSLLMVPVMGPTKPAAAIGVYWPQVGRAGQADLNWLLGLAAATSSAIARIGLADAPWAPTFRVLAS
jgi:hypothetical protein